MAVTTRAQNSPPIIRMKEQQQQQQPEEERNEDGEEEEKSLNDPSIDWSARRRRDRSKFYAQICRLKYKCVLALAFAILGSIQIAALIVGRAVTNTGAGGVGVGTIEKVFKKWLSNETVSLVSD